MNIINPSENKIFTIDIETIAFNFTAKFDNLSDAMIYYESQKKLAGVTKISKPKRQLPRM